jgi:hypothetical protein
VCTLSVTSPFQSRCERSGINLGERSGINLGESPELAPTGAATEATPPGGDVGCKLTLTAVTTSSGALPSVCAGTAGFCCAGRVLLAAWHIACQCLPQVYTVMQVIGPRTQCFKV